MRSTRSIIAFAFVAITFLSGCLSGSREALVTVAMEALELRANEGLYYHEDQPFTGLAQLQNANGLLIEEINFVAGKRDGIRKKWYDHGQISFQAHYVQGRLHGTSQTWWANGLLRTESHFVNGIVDGTQRQWYKSGVLFKEINLADGKEEGMQKAWRENGKIYNNYEARNGRIYGLKRANLCYELSDEEVQFAD